MTQPADLTMFLDPLRIPKTVTPTAGELDVQLVSADVQIHSQLPPTPMWTFEGDFPGPVIEVRRGEPLKVAWQNRITTPFPAVVGNVPWTGTPPTPPNPPVENSPGLDPSVIDPKAGPLPAWNVVHLHGAVTDAGNDGWTDNAVLPGSEQLSDYPNDQNATALWYHDHAMGITRLNVYTGLAGMYLIRDDEEDALGLPSGEYEVPLLLSDRNLETAEDGSLTGQLLYKTSGPLPFFGPYSLVNGCLWPYLEVQPRWYRFRVLNGSSARAYRLHLIDENDQRVPGVVWQIGTDSGLLGAPIPLSDNGLTLAPAERVDLLIDFGALGGRTLRLVNSAQSPYDNEPLTLAPGAPDPANRLVQPELLQFRVDSASEPDAFTLPDTLAASYQRLGHDSLPEDHNHRVLFLARSANGTFQLWEAAPNDALAPPAGAYQDGIIQVQHLNDPVQTFQRQSADFNDRLNWRVRQDDWEVWTIINVSRVLHPVHIHLIKFQLLGRDSLDASGFSQQGGGTQGGKPVLWGGPLPLDPADLGWKDTLRINPGEVVRIAGRFTGATGRFMYHCHILDHEDDGMMRPFTVTPGAVADFTGMGGMGGMNM